MRKMAVTAIALTILTILMAPGYAIEAQEEGLQAVLGDLNILTEGGRRVVALSLSEVLNLALRRSILLKSTLIGEDIARSGITAALGRNHPTLTNSIDTGRDITAFFSFGAGSRVDSTSYNATISQPMDNGIELSATFKETSSQVDSFSLSKSGEASNFSSRGDFETSSLTGAVSVPIFQDWGRSLNEVPVRLAEVGLNSSRIDTRKTKLELLRLVATTYWDLVGVLQNIQVTGDAVKLSEQLLRDNRERLKAGVLSPADVKISEAQLATDRLALLTARVDFQRIEDQVRAALALEQIDLGLKPVEEPTLRELVFDLEQLLEKAFANEPVLRSLEADLERNRYELVEQLNKGETDLDLDLKYTLNGFGKDTSGATAGLSNTDLQGYGVTLTWTVPLFDNVTPANIRAKRLERAQVELRIANVKSELTVRVQAVQRLLSLGEEEVKTARIAVSLQNELLQNEIERFKLGESTSFQVAEAQQDNALARQREILARIRYEKIFLDLLLVTGDIFAQYGLPDDSL